MSDDAMPAKNSEGVEPSPPAPVRSGAWLGWLGIVLTLGYLALIGWYLDWSIAPIRALKEANDFGDFLAGVAAPLAFIWLVLGFFQQGIELRHQVEEIERSVKHQGDLAQVAREDLQLNQQADQRERALRQREERQRREADQRRYRDLLQRLRGILSPTFQAFLMRRNWLAQPGNTTPLMDFRDKIGEEFRSVERQLSRLQPLIGQLSASDMLTMFEIMEAVHLGIIAASDVSPSASAKLDAAVLSFIIDCKQFGLEPSAATESHP